MTLIVGLTGNIGSGKSTVSKIFEALDIPVFYADDEAKKILNSEIIIKKIVEIFGENINEGKKINKAKLASKVFEDKRLLKKLNEIIHPEVYKCFLKWLQSHKNAKYAVMEAAILFESGFDKYVSLSVNVNTNQEKRIERVLKRDRINRKSIIARMENQYSDEEKIKLADFTIDNNGKRLVIPQVIKIHKFIINK